MKFLVEIEIKDFNIESGEETETHLTVEDLRNQLQIGFEDTVGDNGFSFIAYDLENKGWLPSIKGFNINEI